MEQFYVSARSNQGEIADAPRVVAAGDLALADDKRDARSAGRANRGGSDPRVRFDGNLRQTLLAEPPLQVARCLVLESEHVHQTGIERLLSEERAVVNGCPDVVPVFIAPTGDYIYEVGIVLVQNRAPHLLRFRPHVGA